MGKSIGIDLGTTNTAIAVFIDGRPRVLEDEKGYKVLPSCVSWKGEGRYVIGQAAKNLILSAPNRTVHAVKRLIGRRFDSAEVQRTRERVGFDIVQAPDGGVAVRLGEETLTPSEVSSIILQVARQIAERALGEAIDEAVITVPAYFTHAQREATLQAARMAGLHCERLLNEPTAAALAYGYRKELDRQLLIYDLGGGTLDVCVLRLAEGVYESIASRGDSFLGGEDFDYRLVDHLADHFQSKYGVDLREDRVNLQRLKDAAERAKCELSFTDRTTVLVPRIYEDINLELVVSRTTLEALVEDLVTRTIEITRRTLDDAGLAASEIDDVILVGGQTRMPKVREAITGLFGREPNRSVHPEEVVAIGAAVHANTLADPTGAAVLLDITPFDLGIDSVGGMFAPIIPRNSKIPASRTRAFATVHDNQDRVRIVVRQGEHIKAEENEFLGEFVLEGITPQPAMEAKVNVTFRLDANGMLHIQATENATGERKQITIRNYAQLVAGEGETAGVRPQIQGDPRKPRTEISVPASSGSGETLVPIDPPPAPVADKASRFASLLGRVFGGRGKAATGKAAANGASKDPVRDVRLVGEARVGAFGEEEEKEGAASAAPRAPATTGEPAKAVPCTDIGIDLSMATPPPGMALDQGDLEDLPATATVEDEIAPPPRAASLGLAGEALSSLPGAPNPWDDEVDALPLGNLGAEDLAGLGETDLEEAPLWSPSHAPRPGRAPPDEPPKASRKPARLRMNYRNIDAFIQEYRDNLARGGTFIRTPKPLAVGRECAFEVRIPGEDAPLVFEGVVTWSSASLPELSAGQEEGMGIEFRLDAAVRARMEALLARGMRR
jgi:molecular chaperone DnaK